MLHGLQVWRESARLLIPFCDQMCARAKQYRTDKNADEKREEETAKENQQRVYRVAIQLKAARLVKAIDAAGLADDVKLALRVILRIRPSRKSRAYANKGLRRRLFLRNGTSSTRTRSTMRGSAKTQVLGGLSSEADGRTFAGVQA